MDTSPDSSPTPAEIVAGLDRATKIRILSGADRFELEGLPHLGLDGIDISDGPHGLRQQQRGGDHLGLQQAVSSTCFPTAATLGSSYTQIITFALVIVVLAAKPNGLFGRMDVKKV